MSHQSDWVYFKQPIKLHLVKVNHTCEDFILILEQPSLLFYKQKQVFFCWLYPDLTNAVFTVIKPRTVKMGFKRVKNSIIS